jgi:hypothetical protein
MGGFFTRERFGRPQVLAGLLLLLFVAQCLWLMNRGLRLRPDSSEVFRIREGLGQWHGEWIAGTLSGTRPEAWENLPPGWAQPGWIENGGYDCNHSALWYLIASAPLLVRPGAMPSDVYRGWLARAPYLIFGVLLGASLWYVSRRLYGNAGGYIALGLYCFSPGIIRSSALWFAQPELGGAWGAFGTIFTAIAVAHTLYAPREVVLWNWRRILLLGVSLALAVGSQFSLILVVPLALGFMLYVAPTRRLAAALIWAAACGIGLLLVYASYFFHTRAFWQAMRHASFLGIAWRAFAMPEAYQHMLVELRESSPALAVALTLALIVYVAWPRARYFGNTAPLLVAAFFLLLRVGTPHYPGLGFELMAVPFLFVFVAGILSDLLETRHRSLVLACLWGLLVASGLWNVWELARAVPT